MLVKNSTANAQENTHLRKVVEILEDQLSNLGIRVSNLEKDHDTNVHRIKDLEERTNKLQSQYSGRISSLEKAIASGSHSMPTTTPEVLKLQHYQLSLLTMHNC